VLPPQPEPGQCLPDRFWRSDPSQSHALDLTVDENSQRVWRAKGFPITATRVLRDRDPVLADESDLIPRAVEVRDFTPPGR